MTIGGSIALIVIGAVLALAVQFDPQGLDLNMIGVILMIGGSVGLVLSLVFNQRRRVVRRQPSGAVDEEL